MRAFADGNWLESNLNALNQSNQYMSITAIGYAVLQVGCVIVFIMWFRRAYFDLHQLIRSGLKMSEGWAAGGWFIPIYWWWGPYSIATDLFKTTEALLVSHDLTKLKPQRHLVAGWWWALWIIGNISVNIENQMNKSAYINTLILSSYISIFSTVVTIGAAILAIKMIQMYREMEELLPKITDVSTSLDDTSDLLDSDL